MFLFNVCCWSSCMLGGRLTTEELAAGSSGHQSGRLGGWMVGRPTISKTQQPFNCSEGMVQIFSPKIHTFETTVYYLWQATRVEEREAGWVGDPRSQKPNYCSFRIQHTWEFLKLGHLLEAGWETHNLLNLLLLNFSEGIVQIFIGPRSDHSLPMSLTD